MKPNVVLLSDMTAIYTMNKTLGVYAVASALRKAGIEVRVIHHLSVFTDDEILALLGAAVNDKTLFVGVNNFFYASVEQLSGSEDSSHAALKHSELGSIAPHGKHLNKSLIEAITAKNPSCKLVLGGPTAVDRPYNRDFDYVVMGYAESSVVNLAKHLLGEAALRHSYKSIYGPVIITDSKASGFDFNKSSIVYTDDDIILPGEVLGIEIGRGCIFKCAFCAYPLNGKKSVDYIRHRDIIVEELLRNYQNYGITRYMVIDDTFNDSVEKCKMMLEISQALPFKLEWWGYIRLDLLVAHPETVPMLFNSGLTSAFFGIETLNPLAAKRIGKGGSRSRQIDMLNYIKDQWGDKVSLQGAFIFGLPGEDIASMQKTAQFLLSDSNPLDSWHVGPLVLKHNPEKNSAEFFSDIELNYEKYGYTKVGVSSSAGVSASSPNRDNSYVLWENEHTSFMEVRSLAHSLMQHPKQRLSGRAALLLAGLKLPLECFLNKSPADINWTIVDRAKMKRAVEYKTRMFASVGMQYAPAASPAFFTEFIARRAA